MIENIWITIYLINLDNNISDKGLIFKLYKNSYNSIAKITQIICFKNGQKLNRNCSKDIQLDNR